MTDDFKFEIPPEARERTERLRAYFVSRFMEGLGSDFKQALMEKVQAMADEEARKEDRIRELEARLATYEDEHNLNSQLMQQALVMKDKIEQLEFSLAKEKNGADMWRHNHEVVFEDFVRVQAELKKVTFERDQLRIALLPTRQEEK